MFRENHFCEFEVVEDLVFCLVCGELYGGDCQ